MLNVFNLLQWCLNRLIPTQSPHSGVNVSPEMAVPDQGFKATSVTITTTSMMMPMAMHHRHDDDDDDQQHYRQQHGHRCRLCRLCRGLGTPSPPCARLHLRPGEGPVRGFDGSGLRKSGLVHRGYTNTRMFKLALRFRFMLFCQPWVYKLKKS